MAKKKRKGAKPKSSAKSRKSTRPLKPNKTIGILHSGSAGKSNDPSINAFLAELDDRGYKLNQNLTLDPKKPLWSDDDPKLLNKNAYTLATTKLDLIIAAGGPPSVYAIRNAQTKARTNTNVVFTSFSQLTKPAPNMTGVDARTSDLDPSRLMQLCDLVQKDPKWANQKTFGVLENQTRQDYKSENLQDMADQLNIGLDRVNVTPGSKTAIINSINAAFDGWNKKQPPITVVLVAADPIFNDLRSTVLPAEKAKFAVMHQWHEFTDEGGYASLGTYLVDAYKLAGQIAAEVLDGTDPLKIQVQPLTNITLKTNPATAKRLGL